MATTKYLVLINNHIVRDDQNNPILEVSTKEGVFYITARDKVTDKLPFVEKRLKAVMDAEMSDELYPVVEGKELVIRHSSLYGLKTIQTPLYQLKVEIARTKDRNKRIPGTDFLISEYWEDEELKFNVAELVKYGEVMSYFENLVQTKRPKYTPYTMKFDGKKLMNLIYVDCSLIFNPMETIPYFAEKKLYAPMFNPDYKYELNSFDDPALFTVNIIQGQVKTVMCTPLDALKLMGIEKPINLTSEGIYKLAAGLYVRDNFSATKGGRFIEEILSLPSSITLHVVVDTKNNTRVMVTPSIISAQTKASESADYEYFSMDDSDVTFMKNYIKEFEGKSVSPNSEVLLMIKEAKLIDY